MKTLLKAGFLSILFFSCSTSMSDQSALNTGFEMVPNQEPIETSNRKTSSLTAIQGDISITKKSEEQYNPLLDLKIIKTANYKIEVADVDRSSKKIQKAVRANSAYVSGMNMKVDSYQKSNNITIRVPNSNFEKLMDLIGGEAKFTNHKKINTQDVSEEYVDIETRLKTKKEVKARYEKMLRTQAKTMEEVFFAEEKIRQLQEEIEAKEGRLRFLKDKVAFSTIHLEIYQVVDLEAMAKAHEHGFVDDFKDSFLNGWSIVLNLLLLILNVWPLALLGLGLFFWFLPKFRGFIQRHRA